MIAGATISLFLMVAHVSAGNRGSRPGEPSRPKPGAESENKKAEILDFIIRAQTLNARVESLYRQYLAIRKRGNAEASLHAFGEFRAAKLAEGALYKQAIESTEHLYNVYPDVSGPVTVAPPYDPAMRWMSGLTARWNPQVTDSGPGLMLAVRIKGTDGRDHYGGLTSMNPADPQGRLAITLPDGRTYVLKGTFDVAMQSNNPTGYLAAVLYHESRHFNHLSRPSQDGSGASRSWGYQQEEERDAYHDEYLMAKVFGLAPAETADLKDKWRQFDRDVKDGELDSFNPTPRTEEAWEKIYKDPTRQINLEEEYTELKNAVRIQHDASDARLEDALRDVAMKACQDPESVEVGEVENLPHPYDPKFYQKRVPNGLSGGCVLSLYIYLTSPMPPGQWQTKGTIRRFVYLYQNPAPAPQAPPPVVHLPPPPTQVPPARDMDQFLLARAFRNLAVKACSGPGPIVQSDFDDIDSFPTRSEAYGAAAFAAGLSGCARYVFDRIMAANRPGGRLTGSLLAGWAADWRPTQVVPPPTRRREHEKPRDPCFQEPGSPRGCTQ